MESGGGLSSQCFDLWSADYRLLCLWARADLDYHKQRLFSFFREAIKVEKNRMNGYFHSRWMSLDECHLPFFLNETSINSKKFFKLKWNDFFIPFKRGEGFKEHHFLFVPLWWLPLPNYTGSTRSPTSWLSLLSPAWPCWPPAAPRLCSPHPLVASHPPQHCRTPLTRCLSTFPSILDIQIFEKCI